MTRILLLSVLVVCGACGGWRARDTATQIAVLASFAVDHRQTEDITRDCRESNPIMGRCGEHIEPAAYFLTAGIAHTLVAAALPPRWRTVFQAATIGRQGVSIYRNDRAGY